MPNDAGADLPRRLRASGHRGGARAVAGSRDPGEMGADEPLQHKPPGDKPPEQESLERQIRFVIEADRLKTIAR